MKKSLFFSEVGGVYVFLFVVIVASLVMGYSIAKWIKRKKELYRMAFNNIVLGDNFDSLVAKLNNDFKRINGKRIQHKLIFEGKGTEGFVRKIYIWELPGFYITGSTSGAGIVMMPGNNMQNNFGVVSTGDFNTQKAFIKVVFDNDVAVSKEQQGL
ncbi:MAG: hypothetical protein IKI57_05835 [Clostridia bacterium]|nr:hypothetical protein [Clostridia bacterium]